VLRAVVLTQYRRVTDRRTDRQTDGIAIANLALQRPVKMSLFKQNGIAVCIVVSFYSETVKQYSAPARQLTSKQMRIEYRKQHGLFQCLLGLSKSSNSVKIHSRKSVVSY